MMFWHCSPERNLTHFAAFSGCLDSVVIESARPLNIDARLPLGPIGVGRDADVQLLARRRR